MTIPSLTHLSGPVSLKLQDFRSEPLMACSTRPKPPGAPPDPHRLSRIRCRNARPIHGIGIRGRL